MPRRSLKIGSCKGLHLSQTTEHRLFCPRKGKRDTWMQIHGESHVKAWTKGSWWCQLKTICWSEMNPSTGHAMGIGANTSAWSSVELNKRELQPACMYCGSVFSSSRWRNHPANSPASCWSRLGWSLNQSTNKWPRNCFAHGSTTTPACSTNMLKMCFSHAPQMAVLKVRFIAQLHVWACSTLLM